MSISAIVADRTGAQDYRVRAGGAAMTDQDGVDLSPASSESVAIYGTALAAFNTYRGDPIEIIDEALASDPDFVMGHVLRGYVFMSLWERSVLADLNQVVQRLRELASKSNERERRHAGILQQWASGDWNGARLNLERLNVDYPRDLLALQIGHLCDFFHGDRNNLVGRIARALPHWSGADRGYSYLLGMRAFGLEECGDYAAAEACGRRALELSPDDCWAHHAVTHVLEMQCRQREGLAFMQSREADWAQEDNAFQFHNWWHKALFHLDLGEVEQVLHIYDHGVRAQPETVQMMMLDAAALLWRVHLQGHDVGDRWAELSRCYAVDSEAGFYAFNDMHAMMTLVAGGQYDAASSRLGAVEVALERDDTNAQMSARVGLSVARAIHAFGNERYGDAVDHLMPIRYSAYHFGGSHAQRDIIHRTLIESATRAGDRTLALALTDERQVLRPECPFSISLNARARAMTLA